MIRLRFGVESRIRTRTSTVWYTVRVRIFLYLKIGPILYRFSCLLLIHTVILYSIVVGSPPFPLVSRSTCHSTVHRAINSLAGLLTRVDMARLPQWSYRTRGGRRNLLHLPPSIVHTIPSTSDRLWSEVRLTCS